MQLPNNFEHRSREERIRYLSELAHHTDEKLVRTEIDTEERQALREDLTEASIAINRLEQEKKAVLEDYKERLKEPKKKFAKTLEQLENGYEEEMKTVFGYDDQASGDMVYYDEYGREVERRKLRPAERQTRIRSIHDNQ